MQFSLECARFGCLLLCCSAYVKLQQHTAVHHLIRSADVRGAMADTCALLLLITVQAAGLVPIVEPELLIEGVHTAQEFAAATERTLGAVYAALSSAQVHLEV
jgi:fructose-bisphosphate aldolase class 1